MPFQIFQPRKTLSKKLIIDVLFVLLPFFLFIVNAYTVKSWIVDDAGISFAYARNFANGYGLVSQAGMPPVEGYSNFTWVIFWAPFFLLHLFDPIVTPKVVSLILVLMIFVALYYYFPLITGRRNIAAFFVLTLLAINTSFFSWATSGLENPLYVLFILLLVFHVATFPENTKYWGRKVILVVVLSVLIALTRPDGILYLALFPLFFVLQGFSKFQPRKEIIRTYIIYIASVVLLYSLFLAWRLVYFHDIFPNTFYAKRGYDPETFMSLFMLKQEFYNRIYELFGAAAGDASGYVFFGLIVSILLLVGTGRLKKADCVIFFALFLSILNFLLLPRDWMKEFRFATPFYPLLYTSLFIIAEKAIDLMAFKLTLKILLASFLLIGFMVSCLFYFAGRTASFRIQPTLGLIQVAHVQADVFNEYASDLGMDNASVLVPDLGGTLLYSQLHVIDMAGLCDRTIGRTYYDNNNQAFRDYVFEVAKPTFISIQGGWVPSTRFNDDPRFQRDYVIIRESVETWLSKHGNLSYYTGRYVRKDSLIGREDRLRKSQLLTSP